MDAKITKLRLSRMLSYDWLKIVGLATAVIFVWVLVFTMTATRVIPSQQFQVSSYLGNDSVKSALNDSLYDDLKEGTFTHEVLESGVVDLNVGDASTAYQLLQARTTTNEIDLMFVSMQPDENYAATTTTSDGSEEITYSQTYLESLVYSYSHQLFNLDPEAENGFFASLTAYLQKYYGEEYETGTLNAELVESDFRARIARNKDKRYKKESQIEKGIQGEIERLEKYRQALIDFHDYLDKGYIELVTTSYTPTEQESAYGYTAWNRVYSVNICPDEKTMGRLSEYVSYTTSYEDEEGNQKYKSTAKDMNVCLFNSNGSEECYRYEGLVYLTNLVKKIVVVG